MAPVAVTPVPAFWYYVIAGGGALVLLACAALVLALCCHRYRLAAKKSPHSVAYQGSHYPSTTLSGPCLEPMLTIRLDKGEPVSHC